ncbi:hypothetical protein [Pleionea sediminis]|uniref:hypothetical protein n=1 Tax=Pleionea sediminis TaxID=2569479 RepID=UPI001185BD1F|nr:hypothetical protein [Pleionea sediminis]
MKFISIAALLISPIINAEVLIHKCVLSELENEGYKETELQYDQSFLETAVNHHKKQIASIGKSGFELSQPNIDESAWYLIKLGEEAWVIRNSNCHKGGDTGVTTSKPLK